MTTISFLRHGKTEWNATGRFMSHTDLPLSPAGEAEVRAALPVLRQLPPFTVIASPSIRAVQTAEIVVEGLDLSGFETSEDLVELDFGVFEGFTAGELQGGQNAVSFAEWQDPDSVSAGPPKGESWDAAARRAARALDRLSQDEGHTLVVSHGYFIRAVLVTAFGGLHPRNLRRLELSNAGVTSISNSRGYWRMDFHNVSDTRDAS